jgi:uncharacterized membrane protein YccC
VIPPLRRTLDDVRTAAAIAPVRPAYAAGLRAAVATVVPLAIAQIYGWPGGTWMALAGFTGTLADKGGSYRTRAETIAALALAGAAAAALGTVVGTRLVLAIPLTFGVGLACGLARIWGSAGASVGGSVLNIFVIALAAPGLGGTVAAGRARDVLLGGLWAMALALLLWPLRPYRPLRLAVANCYPALAGYLFELAAQAGPDGEGTAEPARGSLATRRALEAARSVVANTRRGRLGETERGERLLLLREAADQVLGHLVALWETLDAVPAGLRDPRAQVYLAETLRSIAETMEQLAQAVESERAEIDVTIGWSGAALRATGGADPRGSRDSYRHAALLLDRLAQYAETARANAAGLNRGTRGGAPAGTAAAIEPEPGPPLMVRLRAVLSRDSLVLRYALRLALVTAAAVGLTSALGLKRGYWVTITVVIILQPYTGATALRARQRVLGTVLGGMLAAATGALLHNPMAILAPAFVFTATSVALLPLNYAAFSVFLTPTFVLLAEAGAQDWHLVGVRIMNTMLGGALALLGGRWLWPSPESERVPGYLAAAIRAVRNYLGGVAAAFGDTSDAAGRRLRGLRREAGLAALNAEDALERLLGEYRGPAERLAPLMTCIAFTRRLVASTAALALTRFAPDAPAPEVVAPFVQRATSLLDQLAQAVAETRLPTPFPSLEEIEPAIAVLPPLVRARAERLGAQLRSLHDSAERWIVGRR